MTVVAVVESAMSATTLPPFPLNGGGGSWQKTLAAILNDLVSSFPTAKMATKADGRIFVILAFPRDGENGQGAPCPYKVHRITEWRASVKHLFEHLFRF